MYNAYVKYSIYIYIYIDIYTYINYNINNCDWYKIRLKSLSKCSYIFIVILYVDISAMYKFYIRRQQSINDELFVIQL